MFYPAVKLQIYGEDLVFGPGLAALLTHIEESGSMKEACAKMDMSYSKGWKIVNRAERELGYELLTRRHGGRQGGNCAVTEEGRAFLERYRRMEADVKRYAKEIFGAYFPEYGEEG